jgi:hypothetical protein
MMTIEKSVSSLHVNHKYRRRERARRGEGKMLTEGIISWN